MIDIENSQIFYMKRVRLSWCKKLVTFLHTDIKLRHYIPYIYIKLGQALNLVLDTLILTLALHSEE